MVSSIFPEGVNLKGDILFQRKRRALGSLFMYGVHSTFLYEKIGFQSFMSVKILWGLLD